MGLSLKGITKGIGKVATNVGKAVKKGAGDVGHAAGSVLDNPLTKSALAAALAATGVGAPAAAAILAGEAGAGSLLKKGGNIGGALKSAAGSAIQSALPGVGDTIQSALPGVISEMGGKIPLPSIPGLPGGISIPGLGNVDVGGLAKAAGKVLPLIAGAKDLSDANGAASARNTLMGRMSGIADEQAGQGRDLMAGQAPIRHAAEAQLLQRLKSPPSFIDTANPFSAKFPAPPSSMTAGAPGGSTMLPARIPAAAAAPGAPPVQAPVQGAPTDQYGRLRRAAGMMSR